MSSNRLKLNAGKTEFIWLCTRQQLAKGDMSPLQLKDQLVLPLDKVFDFGVILENRLNYGSARSKRRPQLLLPTMYL